ncbi:hypothetical protein AB0B45_46060 [Nonomuraea sp. NPDC049152]|uniref:hypothetical protein n=1 Tax=Nonomuraea sp. NPDC049152 TaxID=3154350 RepID=UPI0033F394AA
MNDAPPDVVMWRRHPFRATRVRDWFPHVIASLFLIKAEAGVTTLDAAVVVGAAGEARS